MASIAKMISTKVEDFVTAVVEKKLSDPKTVSLFSSPGIDAPPLKDDKMIIVNSEEKTFYCIGSLMISAGAENGEMVIFSRDSNGAIKGKIHIKKDGKIQMNDGNDNAVAHAKLKAEFEIFQNAYNAHKHPAPGGTTSATDTPSTANIDNSKVNDILLPTGGTP